VKDKEFIKELERRLHRAADRYMRGELTESDWGDIVRANLEEAGFSRQLLLNIVKRISEDKDIIRGDPYKVVQIFLKMAEFSEVDGVPETEG
jgi:translation initiation factor 2 beta subunit (eIF-2beta)/eIF-5